MNACQRRRAPHGCGRPRLGRSLRGCRKPVLAGPGERCPPAPGRRRAV